MGTQAAIRAVTTGPWILGGRILIHDSHFIRQPTQQIYDRLQTLIRSVQETSSHLE
jgi:hypothetical protein